MNINRALGYFNNANKSIIVLLSDETQGLVDILIPKNDTYILYSSSKDGLSKGVIAAIFICCGLLLIASLLIVIIFRRPHTPPYEKSLAIKSQFYGDINTSNNII